MNLEEIAKNLQIDDYIPYGNIALKIGAKEQFNQNKKLILVTATNPTPYGEGKTTVAIGLNDAFNKLGYKSILSLREPSMGPVFGLKGGATGGGAARIIPEVPINLHFTGDFHAITAANNLIAAVIDNEIYQGNKLDIQNVVFRRCIDMNDRALRHITIYNGKKHQRDESFNITAASELMAIFCLASSFTDLRARIEDILIGYNSHNQPLYVRDLGITDAVLSLLLDAFKPNLVKSLEGYPVLVHGGPFANIAQGTSSLVSLNTASEYGDYIITEAGFGADAGAFKFIDILCRENAIPLYACVLVTTIRALKYNGNGNLEKGITNLKAHIDNLRLLKANVVVTINRFKDDTEEEINFVLQYCASLGVPCVPNESYTKGSAGNIALVKTILSLTEPPKLNYLYQLDEPLLVKIRAYAQKIAHAKDIVYDEQVAQKIALLDKYPYPICMAKTQYSISHDEHILGYPTDYLLPISDVELANGAKFIKVYCGNILTMPGLNANPSAKEIQTDGVVISLPR